MKGIQERNANVVFVLHAMQIDRRSEPSVKCMSRSEGLALAVRLKVRQYVESSSLSGEGVPSEGLLSNG